jgi:16S rRNA (cytosine1402-N4)-methyltransferase
MEYKHIPVLLNEAIEGLNIKPNGIYVDCTMGGGGHSSEILKRLSKDGFLYCFDQDEYAIYRGQLVLSSISNNYKIIPDNFINLKSQLNDLDVLQVDGILYDLGVSSFHFDIGDRGFSYNFDADLDMRMDTKQSLTAKTIVNTYSYNDLKMIFYKYGEEKFSASIAKKIVEERVKSPIETTFQLSQIIKSSIPAYARRTGGHPGKKVFQALRIAVNDELNVFEKSLRNATSLLKKGGRIVVITFHSLEDRICKNVFREMVEVNIPRGIPIKEKDIKREFKLVNNKVITPSKEEVLKNNRSHSAKMRILEKL